VEKSRTMAHRSPTKPDRDERRENALRPSPYLGYDRDTLAMHLLERGALEIAESQFRRAVWLNPYEPHFKAHLAWCLFKQNRRAEALACIAEVPESDRDDEIREIACILEQPSTPKQEDPNL